MVTSTLVRNLGAYLDQALTLNEHVTRLVSACFYHLSRIRSIRRSIPTPTAIQVANSFINSRVDCCNSLLSGAPACLTDRVQSVLNATARLIYGRGRYDHVTDLIRDRLHWLPVSQRICFKCGLLSCNGLYSSVPYYIIDYCVMKDTTQNRYSLRTSASTHDNLIVPDAKLNSEIVRSRLLVLRSGTHCRTLSRMQSLSKLSKAGSRRIILNWLMMFNVL